MNTEPLMTYDYCIRHSVSHIKDNQQTRGKKKFFFGSEKVGKPNISKHKRSVSCMYFGEKEK